MSPQAAARICWHSLGSKAAAKAVLDVATSTAVLALQSLNRRHKLTLH